MSAFLALALLASPASAGPRWQNNLDWGCRLTDVKGGSFTLLGQIAKRFDPKNLNIQEREQAAVIVLSDTSGRFKDKGARGLYLRIPKPNVYWANLDSTNGLILDFSLRQGTGKAELMNAANKKPVASGPCETRPSKSEAK